jgi:hypothetical protein
MKGTKVPQNGKGFVPPFFGKAMNALILIALFVNDLYNI